MNPLKCEISRLLDIIDQIDSTDQRIHQLEQKKHTMGHYSICEIILGFFLFCLGLYGLFYFFTYSPYYINTDLRFVFFYNNNILLAMVVIVLCVFSSIEFALFVIDKFTFKNFRDSYKNNKWESIYKKELELLYSKQITQTKSLSSEMIPQAYINLECLSFFKKEIQKNQIFTISSLINAYKFKIVNDKNEQLVNKLTKANKKN